MIQRRKKAVKKESSERWLLTYSDLITLLLAFFVVMYAISSADLKKFSRVSAAMKKAFNVGVLESGLTPGILEQSIEPSPSSIGEDDGGMNSEARDYEMIASEMNWIYQQEGISDKVSIGLRPEGIAITVSGNLLFSSGRAELRPDALRFLESLGRILSRIPNAVRVEGHTDDIAPAGTEYRSNWELSGARAVAVVRYLAEVEKVDPGRLSAVAYSQYRPVASNDSARTRSKNRRSEILILYPTPASEHSTAPGSPGHGGSLEEESVIVTR